MNIRTMSALGALGVGVVVGAIVLSPEAAEADRMVTYRSANAELTHGDFQVLPDAGIKVSICGQTLKADGGVAIVVDDMPPCDNFEPGSNPLSSFLNGAGLTRWKNRRGL